MKNGWNILVVEDNDIDFQIMQRHLRNSFDVDIMQRATDRTDLKKINSIPWDLIVSDCHIFDIEEHELLHFIGQAWPKSPCIVVSGSQCPLNTAEFPQVVAVLEKGDHQSLSNTLNTIQQQYG